MKTFLGIIAGIAAWFAIVVCATFIIKAADPALDAALVAHATTVAQWERLAISFLASIVGGWLAALVGRERTRAPLIAGVLLLAFWGYYHVTMIWNQFPVWYHLTFLASLVLLSLLGGRLKRA